MDEWYEVIELPITIDQFHALPTNPAYKYEYFDGCAVLSPRPKAYRAVLDLNPREPIDAAEADHERYPLRPFEDEDWEGLARCFGISFWRVQPFAGLDDAQRLEAARGCLAKTRSGRDGRFLREASFVAADPEDGRPVGAALITVRLAASEDDPFERREDGPLAPHLTWIFVTPSLARHGLGTALLANVTPALLNLGYDRLDSTFLLGNESSTLWHWRSGFRLLEYPASPRRWQRMTPPAPPDPAPEERP